MPELPDIVAYLEALESRAAGKVMKGVRLNSPFVLRTVRPAVTDLAGRRIVRLERIGKRIGIGFEGDLWAVIHLMIAGRLHWRSPDARLSGRNTLAAFDFDEGTLVLTEAGTERRAGLFVMESEEAARSLDAGGLDVLTATLDAFAAALTRENHTLKRALTDPKLFSGIGNAYSDEILHRARMSPLAMTQRLTPDQVSQLATASREVLLEWIARLREEARSGFPRNVTAFREDMAVHGRFGQPCPVCGAKVQRIRYASNETNYCAVCQTAGRLLADRSLSRLLREDWPKRIDEPG